MSYPAREEGLGKYDFILVIYCVAESEQYVIEFLCVPYFWWYFVEFGSFPFVIFVSTTFSSFWVNCSSLISSWLLILFRIVKSLTFGSFQGEYSNVLHTSVFVLLGWQLSVKCSSSYSFYTLHLLSATLYPVKILFRTLATFNRYISSFILNSQCYLYFHRL